MSHVLLIFMTMLHFIDLKCFIQLDLSYCTYGYLWVLMKLLKKIILNDCGAKIMKLRLKFSMQ